MPSLHGDAASAVFEKLSQAAIHRADAYRLLSVGFLDPDEILAEALADGGFQSDLVECIQQLDPEGRSSRALLASIEDSITAFADGPANDLFQVLKVEYAGLFLVPPVAVSPYESAYHSYTQFPREGSAAASVLAAMRDAGVDVSRERCEPADHIASECEFMFYLCHQEAGAWWQGETDSAKLWRRREHVFMTEHLESFVLKFCQRLDEAEVEGLHSIMMDFARVVVRSKVSV